MTDKITSNISQELPFNKFILLEEQTTYTPNSSDIRLRSCSYENISTSLNIPLTIQTFVQTFLEEVFHCETRASMRSQLLMTLRFSKLASLERFHTSFIDGELATSLRIHLVTMFTACNSSIPTLEIELDVLEEELRHYREVHMPFQGRRYQLLRLYHRIVQIHTYKTLLNSLSLYFLSYEKQIMTYERNRSGPFISKP